MTFDAWLAANHYDSAALTESQRKHLMAAWKEETQPAPAPAPTPAPAVPVAQPVVQTTGFDQQMAAIEAENRRIDYIREATVAACQRHVGNPHKVKELRALCDAALADTRTDARAYDLALLRADRSIGPMILTPPSQQQMNETVLEAAICATQRLPGIEKHFTDQQLQAAHSRFRRGIGLQELLTIAGERNNGYRGSPRDTAALCRAAFRVQDNGGAYYGLSADASPSTISVPGILSNVANKFLATMFLYTEQTWRSVAKIKPANDFKQMSTYRLTGENKFELVPAGGEIKHGTLGELTYTNKVDTYGKVLGIDRRDIVNDDLGAFASATQDLGRGAGDALNEVFWAEWLDDSTFFPTDDSNDNYLNSGSTLSLSALNLADVKLRRQTKPDGTPLGAMGAVLLSCATLANTAAQLMGSQGLVVGTTPASGPEKNVFYGRYKAVSSVYLDASPGSTALWYLLCDPMNIAAIEVAFLNGMEAPTVETSEFDFDRLGLAMRAWMDFGVAKQEYRAGIKMGGS